MEAPVRVRAATADDSGVLLEMMLHTVNWHPERERFTAQTVLATPALAHYVSGWPRAGDLGMVADVAGAIVGAAWLRTFPAEDPGYGHVAADVPELAIAVDPSARGRGIGGALLEAVFQAATAAGIRRVSLSVEHGNRAAALYARHGFRTVRGGGDADTMLRELTGDNRAF